MSELPLLGATQMASFAARGFLRFDTVVPEAINTQFLDEVGYQVYAKCVKTVFFMDKVLLPKED